MHVTFHLLLLPTLLSLGAHRHHQQPPQQPYGQHFTIPNPCPAGKGISVDSSGVHHSCINDSGMRP